MGLGRLDALHGTRRIFRQCEGYFLYQHQALHMESLVPKVFRNELFSFLGKPIPTGGRCGIHHLPLLIRVIREDAHNAVQG